jgi:hypothetical protein
VISAKLFVIATSQEAINNDTSTLRNPYIRHALLYEKDCLLFKIHGKNEFGSSFCKVFECILTLVLGW